MLERTLYPLFKERPDEGDLGYLGLIIDSVFIL